MDANVHRSMILFYSSLHTITARNTLFPRENGSCNQITLFSCMEQQKHRRSPPNTTQFLQFSVAQIKPWQSLESFLKYCTNLRGREKAQTASCPSSPIQSSGITLSLGRGALVSALHPMRTAAACAEGDLKGHTQQARTVSLSKKQGIWPGVTEFLAHIPLSMKNEQSQLESVWQPAILYKPPLSTTDFRAKSTILASHVPSLLSKTVPKPHLMTLSWAK